MATIKVNTVTNAAGTGAPNLPNGLTVDGTALASLNTMDTYSQGTTPSSPKNGAVWWDTAASAMKYYLGSAWRTVGAVVVPPVYTGDRMVAMGGNSGNSATYYNTMDYVAIPTPGTAVSFGTMAVARKYMAAGSNGSRGVMSGGEAMGTPSSAIYYITFATTGNTTSFGTLTTTRASPAAASSSSRVMFAGGAYNQLTTEYVTTATTGNGTSLGTLVTAQSNMVGASDGVTAVMANGASPLQYMGIGAGGTATESGSLSVGRYNGIAAASSTSRAVFAGGYYSGSVSGVMDYITYASRTSATSFGTLTVSRQYLTGSSNTTLAVFAGGFNGNSTAYATMDYITIATTGNATSFGSLSVARYGPASSSGN